MALWCRVKGSVTARHLRNSYGECSWQTAEHCSVPGDFHIAPSTESDTEGSKTQGGDVINQRLRRPWTRMQRQDTCCILQSVKPTAACKPLAYGSFEETQETIKAPVGSYTLKRRIHHIPPPPIKATPPPPPPPPPKAHELLSLLFCCGCLRLYLRLAAALYPQLAL